MNKLKRYGLALGVATLGFVLASTAVVATASDAAAYEQLRRQRGQNPDGSTRCERGCQCASEFCCGGCEF